jgi:peptidoglycan/xylan/chitin deacetylase (PgdA/CDA1 family)
MIAVMWLFVAIGVGVLALAHTAPAPFLFDAIVGDRSVWHMPRRTPPAVYLTFDDGPNPTTTPDLLDVLARGGARATFFLIDRHITADTAPLVQRMFAEGHAVAVHSHTRAYMLMSPDRFARTVMAAADRIEQVAGRRPCRAFRPHAGWRSWSMYAGLKKIDYRMIGWSWMLWDWNWFQRRTGRLRLQSRSPSHRQRRHRRHARRRREGAVRRSAAHVEAICAAAAGTARQRLRVRHDLRSVIPICPDRKPDESAVPRSRPRSFSRSFPS